MTEIKNRLRKKANQSQCNFKVAAIAFDKQGKILGFANNKFKFSRRMGGIHAEEALIAQYRKNIAKILICRTGRGGDFLPIEPCEKCQKLAKKFNIKIMSIMEN